MWRLVLGLGSHWDFLFVEFGAQDLRHPGIEQ